MTQRKRSKLYVEMLAKFGANGMAKPMTFGEACDIFGAMQEGEIKAFKGQHTAINQVVQRLALLEQQRGYEVTGTDKAGKVRVKAITR